MARSTAMRPLAALVAVALCASAAPTAHADDRPLATRRFLRELVSGKRPWTTVIDAARGVAFVRYTSGESDPPRVRVGKKLCGDEIVTYLRKERATLQARIAEGENFRCANRGGARCVVGDVGEGTTETRFEFRVDGDHLVLDAIVVANSVYNPSDERKVIAKLRARADAQSCTPAP